MREAATRGMGLPWPYASGEEHCLRKRREIEIGITAAALLVPQVGCLHDNIIRRHR